MDVATVVVVRHVTDGDDDFARRRIGDVGIAAGDRVFHGQLVLRAADIGATTGRPGMLHIEAAVDGELRMKGDAKQSLFL